MSQDKKTRNYRREYDTYHGTAEQKKRRASRNKARKIKVEAGLAHKGDGKDVGHRNRNAMDNSPGNITVQSRKVNRGWNKKR